MSQRCLLALVLSVLSVLLLGCQPAAPPLTGEAIRASLERSGLPVRDIRVLTAENDPNELLGRPNQYTVKVIWTDTRANDEEGRCTVEVFPDDTAMRARATYTATIAATGGIFTRYQYLKASRRALLRLPGALTPDQAKTYEAWLGTL